VATGREIERDAAVEADTIEARDRVRSRRGAVSDLVEVIAGEGLALKTRAILRSGSFHERVITAVAGGRAPHASTPD
jgi:hypothetical protein